FTPDAGQQEYPKLSIGFLRCGSYSVGSMQIVVSHAGIVKLADALHLHPSFAWNFLREALCVGQASHIPPISNGTILFLGGLNSIAQVARIRLSMLLAFFIFFTAHASMSLTIANSCHSPKDRRDCFLALCCFFPL